MASKRPIASVKNPEGRLVELPQDAWAHVLDRHPELVDYLPDLLETLEWPDYRELDPRPGRLRYVRFVGRRSEPRVVTEFAGEKDDVVTAFLTGDLP